MEHYLAAQDALASVRSTGDCPKAARTAENCLYHLKRFKALVNDVINQMATYPEFIVLRESLKMLDQGTDIVVKEMGHEFDAIQEIQKHSKRVNEGFKELSAGIRDVQNDFKQPTITWVDQDIEMQSDD